MEVHHPPPAARPTMHELYADDAPVGHTWPAVDVEAVSDPYSVVAQMLEHPPLASALRDGLSPLADSRSAIEALLLLTDQSLSCPDYKTLGKGWFYPCSRVDYRLHETFTSDASCKRHLASRGHLLGVAVAIAALPAEGLEAAATALLAGALLREVGYRAGGEHSWQPTMDGILAALRAEAVYPLRALNETDLGATMAGQRIPEAPVTSTIQALTQAVMSGEYREWVYGCEAGRRQMQGLCELQIEQWRSRMEMVHEMGTFDLRTYDEDGLELFWAAKIGGPSHGFDYEGQCVLPLMGNARGKGVMVEDPLWPWHPVAWAQLRLLHRAKGKGPVLYLEPVRVEFRFGEDESRHGVIASVEARFPEATAGPSAHGKGADGVGGGMGGGGAVGGFGAAPGGGGEWAGDGLSAMSMQASAYVEAVVRHSVYEAEAMGIPLSLETYLEGDPMVGAFLRSRGWVERVREPLVLIASNGVTEASDSLTFKHDWVQMEDETTAPVLRVLWHPPPASSSPDLSD